MKINLYSTVGKFLSNNHLSKYNYILHYYPTTLNEMEKIILAYNPSVCISSKFQKVL